MRPVVTVSPNHTLLEHGRPSIQEYGTRSAYFLSHNTIQCTNRTLFAMDGTPGRLYHVSAFVQHLQDNRKTKA
jgi:hypothetical protein